MKIGLVINPIAGMGGRVGLKGSDGADIIEKARSLGAVAESGLKARKALEELEEIKEDLTVYSYPGEMGGDLLEEMGFKTVLLKDKLDSFGPENTEEAVGKMKELGLDLILFAGGDGTARNVYKALGEELAVIGIPAGVKIHSSVFATDPRSAGKLALKYLKEGLQLEAHEVMDIDEEAFRNEIVNAKFYGYLLVPQDEELVQFRKSGSTSSSEEELDSIALSLIEEMEEDTVYIIGSGSSLRPIVDELGLDYSLLGVDLILNKKLLIKDAREDQILEAIKGRKAKIFVTIIGGQGYVFGRGNQQISARVIKEVGRENIEIIATKEKLIGLGDRPLLVDTGDEEVNKLFDGYVQVLIGEKRRLLTKIKGL